MNSRSARMLVAMLIISGALLSAQTPQSPGSELRFDAVSVKPALSPFEMGRLAASGGAVPLVQRDYETPNGRLYIGNSTLESLMMRAYEIKKYQLSGGPAWLDMDYFEITASAGRDATSDEMRAMLKTLLTDRFGLRFHEETRQVSMYALVLARTDGRLGPGLKRTSAECENTIEARKKGTAPDPAPPRGRPTEPACGMMSMMSTAAGADTRMYGGFPIADLVSMISSELNGPVVDRTGLEGRFDITVQFASSRRSLAVRADGANSDPGPGLMDAVQEQLGLKLEKQTGPLKVIVVDAANRPEPN